MRAGVQAAFLSVYLATAVTLSALFVWQRDVFPIKGRDWPVVMLLELAQVSLVVVWCLRRINRGFPCWASCESLCADVLER